MSRSPRPPGRKYVEGSPPRTVGRDYMSAPQDAGAPPDLLGDGADPAVDGAGSADGAVVAGSAAGGNGAAAAVVAAPPGASEPPRRAGMRQAFDSFRLRDFRYLTFSTIAVGYGQWAQQIGIFWLILDLTGSPIQLGALAAVRGVVGTAVSPIGGFMAEKYSRRDVMVWSTLAGAVQAAVLAALVVTGTVAVWHVYAIALVAGTVMSINQPARQALVYDVTSDELLPNAVAMNSAAQNISRITGPPLAGALIGFIGLAAPFIFIVGVQTVAMVLTLMISTQTRQERLTGGPGALRSIAEGFRYSWEDKRILGLIVVGAIPALLIYPYIPFVAVVSEDVLGRGAGGFGVLSSMLGWGSIGGLMLLAYLGNLRRKGLVMVGCYIAYTLLLLGFSLSTVFELSALFLALSGIFHAIAMALNNTLIQLEVRNELRGRVLSLWQMTFGLQPLGSLPMGLLVASQGARVGLSTFMILGLVGFLVFAAVWGSVRRL